MARKQEQKKKMLFFYQMNAWQLDSSMKEWLSEHCPSTFLFTDWWFFQKKTGGGYEYDLGVRPEVIQHNFTQTGSQFQDVDLFVLNIEIFKTDYWHSDAEIELGFDNLILAADTVREMYPGQRLGLYRIFPNRQFWAPAGYRFAVENPTHPRHDEYVRRYRKWKNRNARAKYGRSREGDYEERGLADAYDVCLPSVYTFGGHSQFKDLALQEHYLRDNLKEARQYQKQVYAYIQPMYPDLGFKRVPLDLWELVLDSCRELADGVVLYTSVPTSAEEEWFKFTKEYIAAYA